MVEVKRTPIKWTSVIMGIVIALILGSILLILLGSFGSMIAYLIATIYVGYTVVGDYMDGTIHGELVGMFSEIIFGSIGLFGLGTILGLGTVEYGTFITNIIIAAIIGAIGGAIGVLIKGQA